MTSSRTARILSVHAIAIGALAAACAERPSLDAVAEGYVRAALQLAQHDAGLVEAWRGPQTFTPGARIPVAALLDDIRDAQRGVDVLASDLSNSRAKWRIGYLDGQLRALHFAAERLLGRSTSVDEQAREEFAVTFSRPDADALQHTRSEIDRLLPGGGSLAGRLTDFRRRTTIPTERRMAVMQAALEACRGALSSLIDFPEDERVAVFFRNNMGWDAYAHYSGNHHTAIDISDAGPLDVSRALRLACHEGYAGHHLQHLLIDRALEHQSWPELQLTPAFGRHLLLAEGAAEVGADLAFTLNKRAALYRDRLLPAAGLNAAELDSLVRIDELLPALLPVVTDVAREYLDSRITQERALARLTNEALVADPAATLGFIERRRARGLVYGEGRRVIYSMMATRDLEGLRALIPDLAAVQ